LLQVTWVVTRFVTFWNQTPYVLLVFETDGPGRPFVGAKKEKEGRSWHSDVEDGTIFFEQQRLESGHAVQILLRFKARTWPDGQKLGPYKEEGGLWFGGSTYSQEVTRYMSARAAQFTQDKQYEKSASEQWRQGRLIQLGFTLAYAVGGWIGIAIVKFAIGWIVRGFLGIPSGKDSLAEPSHPPSQSATGA